MSENENEQEERLTEEEFADRFAGDIEHLNRYAFITSKGNPIAEDVVADVFLKLIPVLHRGFGPTAKNFGPYVRSVIRHELISNWRKTRRAINVDSIQEVSDESLAPFSPLTHDQTWDPEAIRSAFQDLPQRSQELLYLREVNGENFSTIAQQLSLSEGAAYTAAHRARESLRVKYLVHITSEDSLCGRYDREYLAFFARERTTFRRTEAIKDHLEICTKCRSAVRRMSGIRLPLGALILVVGLLPAGWTMDPTNAAAVEGGGQNDATHTASQTGSVLSPTRVLLKHTASALLLTIFGIAVAGSISATSINSDSATAQEATGPELVETGEASECPTSATAGRQTGVYDSSELPPPGGSNASQAEPTSVPSETTLRNGDALGCRQQSGLVVVYAAQATNVTGSWTPPSAEFLLGVPNSKIQLNISHSGGTTPYTVQILTGDGLRLTQFPSGCLVSGENLLCTPTSLEQSQNAYTLEFKATVLPQHDSLLPNAKIFVPRCVVQ